jgi:hypothetical protein
VTEKGSRAVVYDVESKFRPSAAAEHAPDPGQEAAAGVGVHLDRVVHPTHAIGLAIDDLARQQINRQRLHHGPGNLVLRVLPLFILADRS